MNIIDKMGQTKRLKLQTTNRACSDVSLRYRQVCIFLAVIPIQDVFDLKDT